MGRAEHKPGSVSFIDSGANRPAVLVVGGKPLRKPVARSASRERLVAVFGRERSHPPNDGTAD